MLLDFTGLTLSFTEIWSEWFLFLRVGVSGVAGWFRYRRAGSTEKWVAQWNPVKLGRPNAKVAAESFVYEPPFSRAAIVVFGRMRNGLRNFHRAASFLVAASWIWSMLGYCRITGQFWARIFLVVLKEQFEIASAWIWLLVWTPGATVTGFLRIRWSIMTSLQGPRSQVTNRNQDRRITSLIAIEMNLKYYLKRETTAKSPDFTKVDPQLSKTIVALLALSVRWMGERFSRTLANHLATVT